MDTAQAFVSNSLGFTRSAICRRLHPASISPNGGQGGTHPGRLRDCGKIVGVLLSDIGTQEEGERAVQTLRGLGSVLVDTIARMPYCAMQRQLDVSYPKGQRHYWKSVFLDSLTNDVIDVMIETMSDSPSPLNLILLETYGGAVARVTSDSTAFGHRDAT